MSGKKEGSGGPGGGAWFPPRAACPHPGRPGSRDSRDPSAPFWGQAVPKHRLRASSFGAQAKEAKGFPGAQPAVGAGWAQAPALRAAGGLMWTPGEAEWRAGSFALLPAC